MGGMAMSRRWCRPMDRDCHRRHRSCDTRWRLEGGKQLMLKLSESSSRSSGVGVGSEQGSSLTFVALVRVRVKTSKAPPGWLCWLGVRHRMR